MSATRSQNRQQTKSNGCRRSRFKPLLRLALPFFSLKTHQILPNTIDLRPLFNPIDEQYNIGSCVGNALASMFEYHYHYTTGRFKRFSRLFIYYNARMMEDEISQRDATAFDSGADLQFALVSLMKFGCCEEEIWPFYDHLINIQPTSSAYFHAEKYQLLELRRLSNDIHQLRQCLSEGYPFVMAIRIFPSFDFNHHGYIPMPKNHEIASQYRHAVVCVGYSHTERVFIIRNSHGIFWGDHGYGYLPYEYVADKYLTKDIWAIQSVSNMDSIDDRLKRQQSFEKLQSTLKTTDEFYSSDDDDDDELSRQLAQEFPAPPSSGHWTKMSNETNPVFVSPMIFPATPLIQPYSFYNLMLSSPSFSNTY